MCGHLHEVDIDIWYICSMYLQLHLHCICGSFAALSVRIYLRLYMPFAASLLSLHPCLFALCRLVITQKWGTKKTETHKKAGKKNENENGISIFVFLICFAFRISVFCFCFLYFFSIYFLIIIVGCALAAVRPTVRPTVCKGQSQSHLRDFLTHYDFTQYAV